MKLKQNSFKNFDHEYTYRSHPLHCNYYPPIQPSSEIHLCWCQRSRITDVAGDYIKFLNQYIMEVVLRTTQG